MNVVVINRKKGERRSRMTLIRAIISPVQNLIRRKIPMRESNPSTGPSRGAAPAAVKGAINRECSGV